MTTPFAYDPLFIITVVIRHYEAHRSWLWLSKRYTDARFTISKTYTLDKMYEDIRGAFNLSPSCHVTLVSYDNEPITSIEELRDKELYVVSTEG